jgi:uncharacterized protein YkwD
MKTFLLLFTLLCLFFSGIFAQFPGYNPSAETWQQANHALKKDDLTTALKLYQQVLGHCQKSNDLICEANAAEAIALVLKKQRNFASAREYCRHSLRTGFPTFRAYYILAQAAFEDANNIADALNYCDEGLKKFPGNEELIYYKRLISANSPKLHVSSSLSSPSPAPRQWEANSNRDSYSGTTPYLSGVENEVISEMNLARSNPAQYAKHLEELKQFYSGNLLKLPGQVPVLTREGVKAVKEAILYLKSAAALPELRASEGLSKAAKDHVIDQSRSGKTGHTGQDGSQPHQRMERYGSWQGISGENIAYGDHNARMIVMQLIIDDGVPDRGHRENIFNSRFRVAGVAIGSHPVYQTICVITYAGDYIEAGKNQQ